MPPSEETCSRRPAWCAPGPAADGASSPCPAAAVFARCPIRAMKRECDGELATAIRVAAIVSHAPECGRDLVRIRAVIFGGEGDVTVAASACGCAQTCSFGNLWHRAAFTPAQIECDRDHRHATPSTISEASKPSEESECAMNVSDSKSMRPDAVGQALTAVATSIGPEVLLPPKACRIRPPSRSKSVPSPPPP